MRTALKIGSFLLLLLLGWYVPMACQQAPNNYSVNKQHMPDPSGTGYRVSPFASTCPPKHVDGDTGRLTSRTTTSKRRVQRLLACPSSPKAVVHVVVTVHASIVKHLFSSSLVLYTESNPTIASYLRWHFGHCYKYRVYRSRLSCCLR